MCAEVIEVYDTMSGLPNMSDRAATEQIFRVGAAATRVFNLKYLFNSKYLFSCIEPKRSVLNDDLCYGFVHKLPISS